MKDELQNQSSEEHEANPVQTEAEPSADETAEDTPTPWRNRKISRRTFMKTSAAGGGALALSMYVAPSMTSMGVPRAYASGTPTPGGGGGEGCTPGYWKNHTGNWVGFSTGDDFDTVFGVDLFNPDIDLETAVNLPGNSLNAFARHATAALLNAAHPQVSYDHTVAEVIQKVQDAVANNTVEATKDEFDDLNNQGSPLCD